MRADTHRDQRRAANAYTAAIGAPATFTQTAQQLPAALHAHGMLGALAFLLAKGERQGVLAALVKHLRDDAIGAWPSQWRTSDGAVKDTRDLLCHRDGPATDELRAMHRETLAFAGWLKRAAETGIPASAPPTNQAGAQAVPRGAAPAGGASAP